MLISILYYKSDRKCNKIVREVTLSLGESFIESKRVNVLRSYLMAIILFNCNHTEKLTTPCCSLLHCQYLLSQI